MESMLLKDGTTIELNMGTDIMKLTTLCKNSGSVSDLLSKLTKDNLSRIQIINSNGSITGVYTDMVLMKGTYEINKNMEILLTIPLREMTKIEQLEKKILELEEGQSVQDQTIAGLVNETV